MFSKLKYFHIFARHLGNVLSILSIRHLLCNLVDVLCLVEAVIFFTSGIDLVFVGGKKYLKINALFSPQNYAQTRVLRENN